MPSHSLVPRFTGLALLAVLPLGCADDTTNTSASATSIGDVDEIDGEVANELGEIGFARHRLCGLLSASRTTDNGSERTARLRTHRDPLLIALGVELQNLGDRVVRTE